MPAFLAMVESDEGYVGDVYFVKHAIEARRAVCDEWQDGDLGGAKVKRMPHFDKYEEQGWVPMIDMIAEGWWSECSYCFAKLTDDEQYDADGEPFELDVSRVVGVFGGHAFCCPEHQKAWRRERDIERMMKAELENRMQAAMESKFGVDGLMFSDKFWCSIQFNDGAPSVRGATLHFDVPGTSNGALTYRLTDPEGTG